VQDSRTGQWLVQIELTRPDAQQFTELTRRMAPHQGAVALVLDGVVVSAPSIQGEIRSGLLEISGAGIDERRAGEIAAELDHR
jgi:preprotein translocase subunit SecD/SecD/SecF fusion protein